MQPTCATMTSVLDRVKNVENLHDTYAERSLVNQLFSPCCKAAVRHKDTVEEIYALDPHENFSLYHEKNATKAEDLVAYLFSLPLNEFFMWLDELSSDRIKKSNQSLLLYVMYSALIRRPDTITEHVPPIWQFSVRNFFHINVLMTLLRNESGQPVAVEPTATGTIEDPEQKVEYFREDLGLNSHHYHWNMVHPWMGTRVSMDSEPTLKDREGELFYYLYQQMLARYDAERLSNGLDRVVPLNDFRSPVQEGYAPNLLGSDGRPYSMRPAGLVLGDTNDVTVTMMEHWHERLSEAIEEGFFRKADGSREEVNILNLADAVRPSYASPNRSLYGSLHNAGHDMIARIHDPDNRYQTCLGAMGTLSTAARDPVFYRWHKFVDDIFVAHKLTLPPYDENELKWEGVSIMNITIGEINSSNTLHTFWNSREIPLKNAIDFPLPQIAKVSVKFLDHNEFQYNIVVNNTTMERQIATVRIFCAPHTGSTDESLHGDFNQQRRLFIEMDKFVVDVEPDQSTITRKSTESSVTSPVPTAFEHKCEMEKQTADQDYYWACGWPQNLLIPKGTAEGLEMDFFVMLTDWKDDMVNAESSHYLSKKNNTSYCGIKGKLFPDKRPMGFPFDRMVPEVSENPITLEEFINGRPNMQYQTVKIQFNEY